MSGMKAFPLMVLLFLLSSAFFSVQGCLRHELQALLSFKSSINDTHGMLKTWKGDDCCEWHGIGCDGTQEGRYVSKLDLAGISREFDSFGFDFKHQDYLDFSVGKIPSVNLSRSLTLYLGSHYSDEICFTVSNLQWLSNLSSLEYLSLSHVGVSDKSWGNIIGSLFHLKHLDLSRCVLPAFTIPSAFSNLSSLIFLDLSHNSFSYIPSWIGKLSSLIHLDFAYNNILGSISNNIRNLTRLEYLDLSNNNMNGTIIEVFFENSSNLEVLCLSHSGLSINISSTWNPSFQLKTLGLKKCRIGGPIPSWISTQFSLSMLDLSANQLMGDLPSWLWDIEQVILSDNHLQGPFTPESSLLWYLDLSMNELRGHLPDDIHVYLPEVEVLILADNKFEGKIPTSLANLRYLSFLDMSNNSLNGNVPATLGNLINLQALNLEDNHLEGEIPKELGSLSNLQSLRIGKNSLQGKLPSSLTNFSRNIQVLDVGGNNLAGNIPHWIANFSSLHVLVMRSNNFKGNLPPEIGQMSKLQVLDLSSNLVSGAIPRSYLRLPAMQNSSLKGGYILFNTTNFTLSYSIDLIVKGQEMYYEYVLSSLICFDLSNNRLNGPLSSEIEKLKGLMYLNLSRNNLNGPIPESLGNLVQLESVDLSFNKFSGKIPWQLGNLTYLAQLNLSYNNLYGRIPQQGGQMLTFDESSYIGNPNLWGCPLKRNCSHPYTRASPPPTVDENDKKEDVFEFPWFGMYFGLFMGVGFFGVVIVLVWNLSWRKKYFEVMDRMIEEMDRLVCV